MNKDKGKERKVEKRKDWKNIETTNVMHVLALEKQKQGKSPKKQEALEEEKLPLKANEHSVILMWSYDFCCLRWFA
jgi:hypothetical protein